MPIYEYRCTSCGHEKEVLQKLSDPPLTECPACGKSTLGKLVSAAGFHLKGSGWYATDFKGGGGKPKPAAGSDDGGAKADAKTGAPAAETVIQAFQLVRHAASLGGVETLASLPAHTSHRQLDPEERSLAGIPEGLVRVSVGIEDVDDLWADIEQALERAGPGGGA